jgi:hypothetical protein
MHTLLLLQALARGVAAMVQACLWALVHTAVVLVA